MNTPPPLDSGSDWDLAVRYHEFKGAAAVDREALRRLRRVSAYAVLKRAQALVGAIVHPMRSVCLPLSEMPPSSASRFELDLDVTLENSALQMASVSGLTDRNISLSEADLWGDGQVPRRQPIVLCVDTSLSMTGEKLALTAVALAVVLLEFSEERVGIVAFENEGVILKAPDEKIGIRRLLERFLDVPAKGYTHLEDGLRTSLRLVRQIRGAHSGRPAVTILLTDGKYTAGKDPAYLAVRFPHLHVLKMGQDRSSLELCRELSRKGRGSLREVKDLRYLPGAMYGVVKQILRGR